MPSESVIVKKAIEAALFDREWYLSTYPDVSTTGLDPINHYMSYGALLGRNPSPNFDTAFYLKKYPDVASSGQNPLEHYILHGQKEGRVTKRTMPSPDKSLSSDERHLVRGFRTETDMHGTKIKLFPEPNFERSGFNLEEHPTSSCLTLPFGSESSSPHLNQPSIGIHLHLHYIEFLDEFCEVLSNIDFKFSLYVSVTQEKLLDSVKERLSSALKNSQVIVKHFPNKGRDIAPFVSGFGKQLQSHEIIAHIHSKKSPHNKLKADWRNQLLTYLMGSKSTVNRLIRHFQESKNIGLMFPIYHHSLKGQISWGTNFNACENLASKLNLSIDKNQLYLFPAGSMFWARSSALKSLLEAGLTYEDFPGEAGQVDGTPAHAIERLFGEIVKQSGFDIIQIKSIKPYNLTQYYPKKWPFPERTDISRIIVKYQKHKRADNKIVVFTALTGGYDKPVRHEYLDPEIDYIIFSDEPVHNSGFWQVRPLDFWHPDKVRMARRIKTNPHVYLEGYDIAVWIDANVIIRQDIKKYIQKLSSQTNAPLAGIPHPLRSCTYQEAQIIVESNRDIGSRVTRQMRAYDTLGFPKNAGLIESNFLVVNLRHPAINSVMSDWWSQINKYSHRDQLSLNFVLWKHNVNWIPLMDENNSLRTASDFAYLGHKRNSGYIKAPLSKRVKNQQIDPLKSNSTMIFKNNVLKTSAVDIIICVHNALDEVRQCLESVALAKRARDTVIIVDDASEALTADYLNEYSDKHSAKLIRNKPPANGYCVSANKGMQITTNPYFLLLNSDTIITRSALEKMLEVAEQDTSVGIVGPLSNAASTQSIPDIGATATQTAVNDLPGGLSIDDMNELCVQWSHPQINPNVPLVHGFCQLIRRKVYERIGGFDELSFPEGYGEENDFCLRATDAGFNLKIATKAYVFHSKSASYKDDNRRQKLMAAGGKKLREKHTEDRLRQAINIMEGHPLLKSIREKANEHYKTCV